MPATAEPVRQFAVSVTRILGMKDIKNTRESIILEIT
jgi:hypothetical protein